MVAANRAPTSTEIAHLVGCGIVGLILLDAAGCSTQPPREYPGYLERAQSRALDGVRVSTAALSAEESTAVYGVQLAHRGIQPVWVEVENSTQSPCWLLFPGIDPNFFPASEAAEAMANSEHDHVDLQRSFAALAFSNPVPAGQTVSGFVLTNLREGVKLLQIDLVSHERSLSTSFLAVVPGMRVDYEQRQVQQRRLLASTDPIDYTDDTAFRAALRALPCCVTNKDASRKGDPLNLIIVGDVTDAFPALIRRGWNVTETTWSGSVIRMIKSVMTRDRYAYAPVSNLYLYGRPQDIALQKARDTIHQRNHLRLWRSSMLYHGRPVWVGQVSRDIGSRMTIHSPTLTTHKIDPDVDEAARALLEDMVYSQGLQAWGRVAGVGAAPKSAPRENLTTDPYYTRGFRLVLVFTATPTSLTEVEFLPWAGDERFIDDTGRAP